MRKKPTPPPHDAVTNGLERALTSAEAPDLSLFDLLDVKLSEFERIGVSALNLARARRARVFHPDFLASVPEGLRRRAEKAMGAINVAYDTLSDTRARGHYIKYTLLRTHYSCSSCNGTGVTRKQRGFTKAELIDCSSCGGRAFLSKGYPK